MCSVWMLLNSAPQPSARGASHRQLILSCFKYLAGGMRLRCRELFIPVLSDEIKDELAVRQLALRHTFL